MKLRDYLLKSGTANKQLNKTEILLCANYASGNASVKTLTKNIMTKLASASGYRTSVVLMYEKALIADNLRAVGRGLLDGMFNKGTLATWLNETAVMSAKMQHRFEDEMGFTVRHESVMSEIGELKRPDSGPKDFKRHAGPKAGTVKPASKTAGKKSPRVEKAIEAKKRIELLPHQKPALIATKPRHEDLDDDDMLDEEHDRVTHQHDHGQTTPVNVPKARDFFSWHQYQMNASKLDKMFAEMLETNHGAVPSVFLDAHCANWLQIMAGYWSSSFAFEYVTHERCDGYVFTMSCKDFAIRVTPVNIAFVDQMHMGDITYTIPASERTEGRMHGLLSSFFKTWTGRRLNAVLQSIGFTCDDGFHVGGKDLVVNYTSGTGVGELLEMQKMPNEQLAWDGKQFGTYDILTMCLDGVRGVKLHSSDSDGAQTEDLSIELDGIEYECLLVAYSEANGKRYVMSYMESKRFHEEYVNGDAMGDHLHTLSNHGFVITHRDDSVTLAFYDDQKKYVEITAYN